VGKELAKTEKQTNPQTIKISGLDVFLHHEILSFSNKNETELFVKTLNSRYLNFHTSEYFSRIFHPPLA
jgi:hypothetical protein